MNIRNKNILTIVAIVLVTIVLCGIVMRLTNNFTEFDPKKTLTYAPNKDNLLYGTIKDGSLEFILDVNAKAEDGVITLKGGVPASDKSSLVVADSPIELTTVKFSKGTYTFTAMDNPSVKTAFVIGKYVGTDGKTYAWLADNNKVSQWYSDVAMANGYNTVHGETVTFTAETEVTFYIIVMEGADFNNLKVYPCVVEGEKEGNFYNDSIFDK